MVTIYATERVLPPRKFGQFVRDRQHPAYWHNRNNDILLRPEPENGGRGVEGSLPGILEGVVEIRIFRMQGNLGTWTRRAVYFPAYPVPLSFISGCLESPAQCGIALGCLVALYSKR